MKVLLLVGLLCSAASAAPQVYEATGILQPETGDVGEFGRIVSATVNLLPEITKVFESVTDNRSTDPRRVQEVMMEFMPLTRTIMKATGDAGGRDFSEDEWQRFNAAEAVMPSVLTFMNKLRDMDFFDNGNNGTPDVTV